MSDTFLGVQPIFDRERRVVAYELLFRGASGGFEDHEIDGDTATSQVIINAFADIGVERLGRDKLLFINLTQGLLASDAIQALPADRVVLEVLETVAITPRLIESATALVDQGFTLALDDFVYTPDWDPLLAIARIVKFDVLGDDKTRIQAKLASLPAAYRPRLLAEKVETQQQFLECIELGFELFQGYYLARPTILTGKRPPENRLQVLRLLARLQDEGSDLKEIEQIISQDVTLSYRLLRFLGNAGISQGRAIHNLMQGIALVGLRAVRQWAALLVLGSLNNKDQQVSLTRSLTTARFCQIVGERHFRHETDALFTVGLFANLDELLLIPLSDALEHLPLEQRIKQAILNHDGFLGQVLAHAKQIEQMDSAIDVPPLPDLDSATLGVYYLEALTWATGIQDQVAQTAA